jgi:hypothetical protein
VENTSCVHRSNGWCVHRRIPVHHTEHPPLPMVDIDVKNKDKDICGTLLTHTESYWYVFEEREAQAGSKLTAIPDDEVKTAWVSKGTG